MVVGIFRFETIMDIIKRIISILTPFIVGGFLAFLINLAMHPMEDFWMKLWKKEKAKEIAGRVKRPLCMTLSFVIVLGILFAILFIILPQIARTIMDIIAMLPDYLTRLESWWNKLGDSLERFSVVLPEIHLNQNDILSRATSFIASYLQTILDTTIGVTTSIATAIFDAVISIVFCIYILAGKERLKEQTRRFVRAVMPEKRAKKLVFITLRVKETFENFTTGQLTEAVILGTLCCIGMLIFGMPYAPAISVLIGVTALVPIFGPFIGAGISALLILAVSPIKALWFLIFILVLQQVEGNVIYPHVVGKSVGLPGMWVLFAVTVGGSAFGVLGMLLSVPVFSVIYVSMEEFVEKRLLQKEASNEKKARKKTNE
jgi:predicted PurR-regulated permease PerM